MKAGEHILSAERLLAQVVAPRQDWVGAIAQAHVEVARLRMEIGPICEKCGCTTSEPCIDAVTGEPCGWVKLDLCSNCATKVVRP